MAEVNISWQKMRPLKAFVLTRFFHLFTLTSISFVSYKEWILVIHSFWLLHLPVTATITFTN